MDLEHVLLPNESLHLSQLRNGTDVLASSSPRSNGLASNESIRDELPRPASYTSIPRAHESSDAFFSFSEDDLVPSTTSWSGTLGDEDYGSGFHPHRRNASPLEVYTKPTGITTDSRISVQRTVLVQSQGGQRDRPPEQPLDSPTSPTSPTQAFSKEESNEKASATDTESISRSKLTKSLSFARKGRSGRDGSQSPKKSVESNSLAGTPNKVSATAMAGRFFSRENSFKGLKSQEEDSKEDKGLVRSLSRGRGKLNKKSIRSQTAVPIEMSPIKSNGLTSDSKKRPVTPLFKSHSNNSVPTLVHAKEDPSGVPPLPTAITTDTIHAVKDKPVRKRDELWSVFRTLESDYVRFQSKSTALKTDVVRATLLPFLRNFASHSANANIRPEDLDRRTNILNKWWTGLLDLLRGHSGSSISGSDRPAILDGMAGIMERCEWRYPPSPFAPLLHRAEAFDYFQTESTASSNSDDFLLESVHHNIRNTFVQNLFAQMGFVVEKMSLKHAPASLVSFCGKACAYAFLFCPGIAEVLTRLWHVKANVLQKLLRTFGLPAYVDMGSSAEAVSSKFPSCVQRLKFTSINQLAKQLRQPPMLPLGVDKIKWRGQWLTRWSGRDSELFYSFARYFHSLALDFLPADLGPKGRVCTPGLLVVQAQMLLNLESTIHRQSTLDVAGTTGPNTTVTFEEMLNADIAAAAIPASPLNATRIMSENRLVIVLKDAVASTSTSLTTFFADSFCRVMQAAIRSTSLYDQSACFTLCDFLQEALTVLIPLQIGPQGIGLPLDWHFLTDVFRRMVDSQNTTTEIRLYALIYALWDFTADAGSWRDDLCFNFLLEQTHFTRSFNHWCPMVRAYYMRLICWRLARYDGEAPSKDIAIFQMLLQRLQDVWANYKYLDEFAKDRKMLRPSTAPCNPAPGRKLLIIRTDTQIATPLLSFNSMLSAIDDPRDKWVSPTEGSTSMTGITASSFFEKVSATLEYGMEVSRKRSGIFRSLWGNRSNDSSPRSRSPRPEQGSAASGQSNPPSTDRSDSRSSMYEHRPSQVHSDNQSKEKSSPAPISKKRRHPPADFRFSLETVDRRPQSTPGDLDLESPRLPLAAHILLQSMPSFEGDRDAMQVPAEYAISMRYAGRALAEWTWVVNECQNFFERRRSEGVQTNREVETPDLGVESFRRLG